MRINSLVILLFFLTTVGQVWAQKPIEIKGQLTSGKEIRLYQTDEGTASELAKIRVKEDGTFRFSFFPDYEGLYVLQASEGSSPNSVFYLKEGDFLEVVLNGNGYQLKGDQNSTENKILSAWNTLSTKKSKESSHTDALLNTFKAESKLFLNNNKSKNKQFNLFLPKFIKWDIVEKMGSIGKALKITDFTRSAKEVYALPNGLKTMNHLIQQEVGKSGKTAAGIEGLKAELDLIQNDTLKGDKVLAYMAEQVSYRGFIEVEGRYSSYLLTKNQQKSMGNYKLKFSNFTPGDVGFEFAYPDKNGKLVKLSDFKGKVVVVDVWATWCGPCLKEVPHLRKLEETLKGKDVVFIGMSTDADKDKGKWKEMIEQEEMKGSVHILAGQGNEFSKFYKISSIPRFLVFDKKGNLVTANSPRPSDPRLKKIIEEELKIVN